MLSVVQPCHRCGADAEMLFGEAVHGSRLSWFGSVSCRSCGPLSEIDGSDSLPNDLRALVLEKAGVWAVHVAPRDRVAAYRALRELLKLSMQEVTDMAKALPGTVKSGLTQAEAISLGNAISSKNIGVVRVHCELPAETRPVSESPVRTALDPTVHASVPLMRTQRTVRNCRANKRLRCPRAWIRLQATNQPDVRRCGVCASDVFFCRTDAETLQHARLGHTVARDEPHPSELPCFHVPATDIQPAFTEAEGRALDLSRREHGIDQLINGRLDHEARACPACGYPVPTFRKSCFVCKLVVGRA